MTRALAALWCLAGVIVAAPAFAQTSSRTPFTGVGLDEPLSQPALLAPALQASSLQGTDIGTFSRVMFSHWATLNGLPPSNDWTTLDARLDALKRQSVPVLLVITDAPIALDHSSTWPDEIRAIAAHVRGRVAGIEIDAPRGPSRPDARTYAFFLKMAAVQIRSVDPGSVVAQTTIGAGDLAWETELYANDVAPEIDLVPIEGGVTELADLVHQRDPTAVVMTTGLSLDAASATAARQWLTEAVTRLGEAPPTAAAFTGSAGAVAAAIASARDLKDLLGAPVVSLDPGSVSLEIQQDGRDVSAQVPHRLLYNPRNGSTYFVCWNTTAGTAPVTVALIDPSGRTPTLRNPLRRQVEPAPAFSADTTTHRSRFNAPPSDEPEIFDFNYGAANTFVSNADVSSTANLSVDEIIFRNQQAEATQTSLYTTYTAALETRFHFRASPTQLFDVVSENRLYASRGDIEWEELSFSVNGAKWGSDRPSFPLLQAEKVLSRPLDLRLSADYRYRLAGIEIVDEHRCYAIDFDPVDPSASRYRGRVWIDTTTFLRVQLDSVQTHLAGPIVSNAVTETYAPVATVDGQAVQFVTHAKTRQLVLIAGRNLLVEKDDWYSDFHVDASDFETRRTAARASDHIMYRDTDRGVRYLVKQGGDRVVSDQLTRRSKALAMGTRIDPAFDFPLPILGINYLNFDFLGTNSQLAMLFAGVFVAGNVQKPRLGHTPFDGSIDFYGIAVPSTDKVFTATGEDVGARVMEIPASTGLNAGWQFSPFQKVTVGYQLLYTHYFAAPDTTANFTVPSSTTTNGASAAYELRWRGYSASASAATFHRMTWEAWGRPGDYDPSQQTYQLYSIGGAKDFLRGPFQAIHVGAAYFGGQHLDRFSMYQFDMFSEVQMHGVPASGVRFPSLVIARGSYSLNVFDQFKLDLFLDQAFGRDPIDRTTWRPVTGTGAAVTFRAPWNTMLTIDVGKGFLPALYRPAGSFILQIMLIKPL